MDVVVVVVGFAREELDEPRGQHPVTFSRGMTAGWDSRFDPVD